MDAAPPLLPSSTSKLMRYYPQLHTQPSSNENLHCGLGRIHDDGGDWPISGSDESLTFPTARRCAGGVSAALRIHHNQSRPKERNVLARLVFALSFAVTAPLLCVSASVVGLSPFFHFGGGGLITGALAACATTNPSTGLCATCTPNTFGELCDRFGYNKQIDFLEVPELIICIVIIVLLVAVWTVFLWFLVWADDDSGEEEKIISENTKKNDDPFAMEEGDDHCDHSGNNNNNSAARTLGDNANDLSAVNEINVNKNRNPRRGAGEVAFIKNNNDSNHNGGNHVKSRRRRNSFNNDDFEDLFVESRGAAEWTNAGPLPPPMGDRRSTQRPPPPPRHSRVGSGDEEKGSSADRRRNRPPPPPSLFGPPQLPIPSSTSFENPPTTITTTLHAQPHLNQRKSPHHSRSGSFSSSNFIITTQSTRRHSTGHDEMQRRQMAETRRPSAATNATTFVGVLSGDTHRSPSFNKPMRIADYEKAERQVNERARREEGRGGGVRRDASSPSPSPSDAADYRNNPTSPSPRGVGGVVIQPTKHSGDTRRDLSPQRNLTSRQCVGPFVCPSFPTPVPIYTPTPAATRQQGEGNAATAAIIAANRHPHRYASPTPTGPHRHVRQLSPPRAGSAPTARRKATMTTTTSAVLDVQRHRRRSSISDFALTTWHVDGEDIVLQATEGRNSCNPCKGDVGRGRGDTDGMRPPASRRTSLQTIRHNGENSGGVRSGSVAPMEQIPPSGLGYDRLDDGSGIVAAATAMNPQNVGITASGGNAGSAVVPRSPSPIPKSRNPLEVFNTHADTNNNNTPLRSNEHITSTHRPLVSTHQNFIYDLRTEPKK